MQDVRTGGVLLLGILTKRWGSTWGAGGEALWTQTLSFLFSPCDVHLCKVLSLQTHPLAHSWTLQPFGFSLFSYYFSFSSRFTQKCLVSTVQSQAAGILSVAVLPKWEALTSSNSRHILPKPQTSQTWVEEGEHTGMFRGWLWFSPVDKPHPTAEDTTSFCSTFLVTSGTETGETAPKPTTYGFSHNPQNPQVFVVYV